MTKAQLLEKLRQSDYILPKDVISSIDVDQLAVYLVQVFNEEREILESEKKFQENYIELVNYLLINDLNRPKETRKNFFDASFLNTLLTIPSTN